ncbi:MAG: TonB-dependent receptor [Bacteroidales bacterium]|nr:TonB-dependent receptor [Bacteroidales bacterium]
MNKTILFAFVVVNCFLFTNRAFGQEEKEDEVDIEEMFDALDMFDMSLEEMVNSEVVSASKTSLKLSEAPAIIDIITAQQLQQYGYRNVGDALELIPGLFVTNDLVSHNVSIRGINGGRNSSSRTIKIMIDGHAVSFKSTSENFIAQELIPLSLIKQIEIIRGPASTLYGANAFLGVVNIITKNGEDMSGVNVSVGTGTSIMGHGELSGGFKKNSIEMILGISADYIDRSGLELPSSTELLDTYMDSEYPGISPFGKETEEDLSKPMSVYGKFKVETSFGDFITSGSFRKLNSSARFFDKNPVSNISLVAINNFYISENFIGSYLDDKLSLDIDFTYSSGSTTDDYLLDYHPTDTTGLHIKPSLAYSALETNIELGYSIIEDLNLLVGVDYSSENHDLLSYVITNTANNTTLPEVTTDGEESFTNLGAFGQVIYKPIEKVTLTAGVRYDDHNIYGGEFNYRLGAVYGFSEKMFTKLLYGTSYRAPTPSQLFSTNPPYNVDDGVLGNKDLEPETANTLEALLTVIPMDKTSITINGFYNKAESIIVIEESGGVSRPVNLADVSSIGAELQLRFKGEKLAINPNLGYQKSTINENNQEEDVKLYPELIANVTVSYNLKILNASLIYNFNSEYTASQNNINKNLNLGRAVDYTLDPHHQLDLSLRSIPFNILKNEDANKGLSISLLVKNILDASYQYPGYYGYDVPAPGRSIYLGVNMSF